MTLGNKTVPLQTYITREERAEFLSLCDKAGISAAAKIRMFIKLEIKKENKS